MNWSNWNEFNKYTQIISSDENKVRELASLTLWCMERLPRIYRDFTKQELNNIVKETKQ